MRARIIDKFIEYRKRINAWFEDENNPAAKNIQNTRSVTWLHYEAGFLDGYEQRKKEEHEEMMDAL